MSTILDFFIKIIEAILSIFGLGKKDESSEEVPVPPPASPYPSSSGGFTMASPAAIAEKLAAEAPPQTPAPEQP